MPLFPTDTNYARTTDDKEAPPTAVKRYAHEIFERKTPYDGVLVSLAQIYSGKGMLSRINEQSGKACNIRRKMRLPRRFLLFGDCGAFSYVGEPCPPFSAADAAALYKQCGVDVGASVDHIPVAEVVTRDKGGKLVRRKLSDSTRRRRMQRTADNAADFLHICRRKRYSFVPMGVIQGIGVSSYIRSVHEYLDMGYEHVALGGLVPRQALILG